MMNFPQDLFILVKWPPWSLKYLSAAYFKESTPYSSILLLFQKAHSYTFTTVYTRVLIYVPELTEAM